MKQLFSFLLCILFLDALGQKDVELDSVRNHVGETVHVRGKVAKISSLGKGKDQKIIIYVGGESPHEKLSIVLYSEETKEPHYLLKHEKYSRGVVIVTGKIELEKGKARIILKNDDNLRFIVDEEVSVQ